MRLRNAVEAVIESGFVEVVSFGYRGHSMFAGFDDPNAPLLARDMLRGAEVEVSERGRVVDVQERERRLFVLVGSPKIENASV